MITVVLHGRLGEKFAHPETGRRWTLEVNNLGEALSAIDHQMGGLFDFIHGHLQAYQGYHVQVNGLTIGEDMLGFRFIGDEISVTPILQGADAKGILQIVAGVALIAIGIVGAAYLGAFAPMVVGLGLSLALGGVARLLISAPDTTLGTQDKTRSSYVFTGPVNTIQQGECVPVAYGEVICGSAVISAGIESEDISN